MEDIKPTKQVLTPNPNRKYRQDLIELKTKVVGLIDQIMAFDLTLEQDHQNAVETGQKLAAEVQKLCSEHLKPRDKKKDLQLDSLEISVRKVKNCREEGLIGWSDTLIAMKNENSFLAGSQGKGLLLVEEGSEIESRSYLGAGKLLDIVYIPPHDCYLLALDWKLYRKDIDNSPPHVFMDLICGWRAGACFRFSNLQQRLIINKDFTNISALNLKTKKLEVELEKTVGSTIADFRVFGERENQVASLTKDGYVVLYGLGAQNRRVIDSHEIQLLRERQEEAVSIAVSCDHKVALVEVGQYDHPSYCSRMLVFRIDDENEDTLVHTTTIDLLGSRIGYKLALECCGSAGTHIVWAGISKDENGVVQLYDYDVEAEELKEVEEMRVSHQEHCPYKLHLLNGSFYYIGQNGQLMSFSLGN